MSKKILTLALVGLLIAAMVLSVSAMAGQGGKMNSQTQRIRTQTSQQISNQQRLRDASGAVNASQKGKQNAQKKGYTYGPGDGTGNQNLGPKDGTGYGAPENR